MSVFSEQWESLKQPLEEPETNVEWVAGEGWVKQEPSIAPTYTPGPEVPPTDAGISGTGKILLVAGGAFLLMMVLGGKR